MANTLGTWHDLGRRIAQARKTAGLSQADLATAVRLDRSVLSRIEDGEHKLDSSELARIAELLTRPISWFMSPSIPTVISRRDNRQVGDESHADIVLETLAGDVALLIELKLLAPPAAFRPQLAVDTVQDAETAARELRDHLGVPPGPLWDLPRLGERVGLYAFVLELDTDRLDGSYVALETGGVAVVNGRVHTGRRRFTLAHELGHHVFEDQFSTEWILGTDGDDRERLINAFAVHLLLPREAVTERWLALNGESEPRAAAVSIGAEYGVSWTAVCAQLRNLTLVDDKLRERLEIERPRKSDYLEAGLSLREDLSPPLVPPAFGQAVVRGYRRSKISPERALQLLRGTVTAEDLPARHDVPLEGMRAELDLRVL